MVSFFGHTVYTGDVLFLYAQNYMFDSVLFLILMLYVVIGCISTFYALFYANIGVNDLCILLFFVVLFSFSAALCE